MRDLTSSLKASKSVSNVCNRWNAWSSCAPNPVTASSVSPMRSNVASHSFLVVRLSSPFVSVAIPNESSRSDTTCHGVTSDSRVAT
ncbi:hypothetical protein HanPSC8_Chr15g0645751 [Helianthus annuus]|nr:hypothetical protein HanPSC8_Chr15g0645751 [Helianthus annuus]